MYNRPPCLEWRERLALRHEDLSPADQQALDRHIQTCEVCSAALADYLFFEARLDALPPPAIRPLPRLSPHFFENTDRQRAENNEQATDKSALRETPPQRPKRDLLWRLLSVAVVGMLILGATMLFRTLNNSAQTSLTAGTLINFTGHADIVSAVAWSPDGKYIATASWDHTVQVWDASNGKLVFTYAGHTDIVYALAWSPNGKYLASGSGDNTVQVWDASNGHTIATYTGHHGLVVALAWSHDSKEIVSGSWDDTAQIWNASTGIHIATLYDPGNNEFIAAVSWSPNDRQIAAGSWGGLVQIWDSQGKLLYTYHGHSDAINTLAWSPNGLYIASGGNDNTIQVWNYQTGATLKVYRGQSKEISSLSWSPNGREIVSGSWDHTAKVWKVFTS